MLRLFSTLRPKESGPNAHILNMLYDCIAAEEALPKKNGFKLRAFRKAVQIIRLQENEIVDGEAARRLEGIGKGIGGRIAAFLNGQEYVSERRAFTVADGVTLALLTSIPTIGRTTAIKLIDAGCRSIPDLQKPEFYSMLTALQRAHVKYYYPLRKSLSPQSVDSITETVRHAVSGSLEIIPTGQYRLGKSEISKISLLFFHRNYAEAPTPTTQEVMNSRQRPRTPFHLAYPDTDIFRETVIQPLEDLCMLCPPFSFHAAQWCGPIRIPDPDEELKDRKDGIENVKGNFHNITMTLAPMNSRAAALITTTGDAEFLRHMRMSAAKLGLHLNEYGLWRQVSNEWKPVDTKTEEDVFDILGLSYVKPENRNFEFLRSS